MTVDDEDLGTVLITVKCDGSYNVNSSFLKHETLKVIIKAANAMAQDILDDG
jgi:hypothetical protein